MSQSQFNKDTQARMQWAINKFGVDKATQSLDTSKLTSDQLSALGLSNRTKVNLGLILLLGVLAFKFLH